MPKTKRTPKLFITSSPPQKKISPWLLHFSVSKGPKFQTFPFQQLAHVFVLLLKFCTRYKFPAAGIPWSLPTQDDHSGIPCICKTPFQHTETTQMKRNHAKEGNIFQLCIFPAKLSRGALTELPRVGHVLFWKEGNPFLGASAPFALPDPSPWWGRGRFERIWERPQSSGSFVSDTIEFPALASAVHLEINKLQINSISISASSVEVNTHHLETKTNYLNVMLMRWYSLKGCTAALTELWGKTCSGFIFFSFSSCSFAGWTDGENVRTLLKSLRGSATETPPKIGEIGGPKPLRAL